MTETKLKPYKQKKFTIRVINKHGDCAFYLGRIRRIGAGFVTKEKTVALMRCPDCGRENYMANVLSGYCTWCPFDANKCEVKGMLK